MAVEVTAAGAAVAAGDEVAGAAGPEGPPLREDSIFKTEAEAGGAGGSGSGGGGGGEPGGVVLPAESPEPSWYLGGFFSG